MTDTQKKDRQRLSLVYVHFLVLGTVVLDYMADALDIGPSVATSVATDLDAVPSEASQSLLSRELFKVR